MNFLLTKTDSVSSQNIDLFPPDHPPFTLVTKQDFFMLHHI